MAEAAPSQAPFASKRCGLDIVPDDIELSDAVTVIREINEYPYGMRIL